MGSDAGELLNWKGSVYGGSHGLSIDPFDYEESEACDQFPFQCERQKVYYRAASFFNGAHLTVQLVLMVSSSCYIQSDAESIDLRLQGTNTSLTITANDLHIEIPALGRRDELNEDMDYASSTTVSESLH